jgi:hypothetical protein
VPLDASFALKHIDKKRWITSMFVRVRSESGRVRNAPPLASERPARIFSMRNGCPVTSDSASALRRI